MFNWIKVISRLSAQDDVMATLDNRIGEIVGRMDACATESAKALSELKQATEAAEAAASRLDSVAEKFRETVAEAEQRIASEKDELSGIGTEIEKLTCALSAKVEDIQKTAHAHLDAVSEKVHSYDANVAELGKEIVRLGDAISEFEKR